MNTATDTLARWRDTVADVLPRNGLGKLLAFVLGLYLIVVLILGMYWSIAPAPFNVKEKAQARPDRCNGNTIG